MRLLQVQPPRPPKGGLEYRYLLCSPRQPAGVGGLFDIKTRYEQNEVLFKTINSEKWWTFLILAFILVIVGIVNVAQGTEKNLPIVGNYARYIAI